MADHRDGDGTDGGHAALARQQALFRLVNEQLSAIDGDGSPERVAVVCECSDQACLERLHVPAATYEAVRRDPARFVLYPGHEAAGLDHVISTDDGYVVAEKRGSDADVVRALDPRALSG